MLTLENQDAAKMKYLDQQLGADRDPGGGERVLRKRNVRTEDFDQLVERIMEQAEALYADWPLAA